MIKLVDVKHGTYESIEALNPRFVRGSLKMRVTVDTEHEPRASEETLVTRLLEAFPGLSGHECRVENGTRSVTAAGAPIRFVPSEPSANQAHVLEHVMIEVLGVFEPRRLRSGVTCAWTDPPERNDVFVECDQSALGEAWSESQLLRHSRLPVPRVREALAVLSDSDLVAAEQPTLSLSTEPWYRMS